MDERLQFVARRLAGEPMAKICRESESLVRGIIRLLTVRPMFAREQPEIAFSWGLLHPQGDRRGGQSGKLRANLADFSPPCGEPDPVARFSRASCDPLN